MQNKINLIARNNGAGITRDLRLLVDAFQHLGHRTSITELGHRSRLSNRLRHAYGYIDQCWRAWSGGRLGARYDVNVMLEQVREEKFRQARVNVLVPNPEWMSAEWLPQLRHVDLVMAKTRHAERIFSDLGCPTQYIGFSSEDCLDLGVQRQRTFFHGPGRSGNKGTGRLLELWSRHPEWPLLTVVWRRKDVPLPDLPANVRLIRRYLGESELRQLQNQSVFHLGPSQTEGYGHSIVESLSVGAVTLTTDAEPMNELVTPDRGVLVPAREAGVQCLSMLYDFDMEAMEAAIEACIAMQEHECIRLGTNARRWYEANHAAFAGRLQKALGSLCPSEISGPALDAVQVSRY